VSRSLRIYNITRQTLLADSGELARSTWRRMQGLLGRERLEPGQALLISPCQGIHTWLMRFPIDVLHVDARGGVCRVVDELPPNRFGPIVWNSKYTVELPAGTVRATGTRVGDQISVE
jgi:hypothetical protein